MKQISILIPNYNGICTTLVSELHKQAEELGIDYEVIVADDGSTQADCVRANYSINELSHCRYLVRQENVGRAAIRNFLASESQYEWLLFIDSDMVIRRADFLRKYCYAPDNPVIVGGVTIGNPQEGNLRSMYEMAAADAHTVEKRCSHPYHDFHTANFLIRRELMLAHPFDLRFRHYGYEDVLLGKQLQQLGIPILHIDNPLSFEVFESNDHFVSKTEEGLRTLFTFQEELQGYSHLLDLSSHWWFPLVRPLVRLWHHCFGQWERKRLTGNRPSLLLFRLYKTGYFISHRDRPFMMT